MAQPETSRFCDPAGIAGAAGPYRTCAHQTEARTEVEDGAPASQQTSLQLLQRWQDFGATWRIVGRTTDSVTVSLCRCDGGEEVQRVTSSEPELLAWLNGRTSSELA
jgi:hypothetical protein